jgi:hypothetical protein
LEGAVAAESERAVEADVAQIKGRRSMVWQDCAGAGRVSPCLGLGGTVNDREATAQVFTRTYAMSPDLTDRATAMANNAEWLARLATHAASQWKDS